MGALTDVFGTLSIAEFVWLVFGFGALWFNARALMLATGDLRYLRDHWRAGMTDTGMSERQMHEEFRIRETVANGQIYEEVAACAINLVVIGIGLMAATVPSRPDQQFSWASIVTASGLIFIVLLLMIASMVRSQTRARLYDRVAARTPRAGVAQEGKS